MRKDRKQGREADKAEAQRLIQIAAGEATVGETTKSRIRRTAQILRWKVERVRHVWHGDASRIEAHEMDQLRAITQGNAGEFSTRNPSENSDSH